MSTFTVPGKIFLMGEYAVLKGGRCLVAALRPGYAFDLNVIPERPTWVHPRSPLGMYQEEIGRGLSISKLSASMAPGFGGSTAELVAGVFADLERLPETRRLWGWYREHFPKASGADLIAQIEALRTNRALFEIENGVSETILRPKLFSKIHVYQIAPHLKLATHEALQNELPPLDLSYLNALVARFKNALEAGDLNGLSVMNEFADELRRVGLETDLAHEIRQALMKMPGVIAVKGCGAGLQDTFLVAGNFVNAPLLQKGAEHLFALGTLEALLW
jgi:hypothetical protein